MAARSAETMAHSAARPPWNGFDMVPSWANRVPVWLAVMLRAWRVVSTVRPRSRATPAAAPNMPLVPVEWKPSRMWRGSAASKMRHPTSTPTRQAVSTSRPDRLAGSARARTAARTGAVG